MVVLLTGLVGVLSTDGRPDFPRLLLVMAGMLGAQLCIGWTNDYFDRETDALHQPSKPVPSGLVDGASCRRRRSLQVWLRSSAPAP